MAFHVVIGAGATGSVIAETLATQGERVRVISRSVRRSAQPRVEHVVIDAADGDVLARASEGARTIFQCAMPRYDRWSEEFPALWQAALWSAERNQAAYVSLSNLYMYGPVVGPYHERLPMAPNTVKGRLRARMWEQALEAHARVGLRVTELRGSDFLGRSAITLFTFMAARELVAGRGARLPGDLDALHSYTYVGDVAKAMIAASRNEAAWGRAFHVPSSTLTTRALAARLMELAHVEGPFSELPEDALKALADSDSIVREIVEMMYLYARPCVIDSSEAERVLGLAATPLDDVLRETIVDLRPQQRA